MILKDTKQIIIRRLFEKGYDGGSIIGPSSYGEDSFGKYFRFEYPHATPNFYYLNKNIVLERWWYHLGLFDTANFKLHDKDDMSLLHYNGDYYIFHDVEVYIATGPYRNNKLDRRAVFKVHEDGEIKEYNIRTEIALKKLLKDLDYKKVTF